MLESITFICTQKYNIPAKIIPAVKEPDYIEHFKFNQDHQSVWIGENYHVSELDHMKQLVIGNWSQYDFYEFCVNTYFNETIAEIPLEDPTDEQKRVIIDIKSKLNNLWDKKVAEYKEKLEQQKYIERDVLNNRTKQSKDIEFDIFNKHKDSLKL